MQIYMLTLFKAVKYYFKRAIHPRRIIISSDKKVSHINISVPAQLCAIFLLSCGVMWSLYATGRFIAVHSTLEAQNNTLRSVTAIKKLDNLFPSVVPPVPTLSKLGIMDPNDTSQAKLALLEQQVNDLKNENEAIVERVKIKADGRIDDLESIVRQTGLNPNAMEKTAVKFKKAKDEDAEGGPYIPTRMPKISEGTSDMFASLDRLETLHQVITNLPFGIPIKRSEEHSSFGNRIDPFNGEMAFHSGLDLVGPIKSPIHSTADGTVISAERDGSYGNVVDIDHGFGVITRYGHLSSISVHKGDKVKKGNIIGVQGSTGRSTGPHLHYEVRYNGEPINPQKFLRTGRLLELGNVSQD
jgi:murein DD-endopeptidase MepM/ murein hydrolase activator NlpD